MKKIRGRARLEIMQAVSCILLIIGAVRNQVDNWGADLLWYRILQGVFYDFAVVMGAVIILYCVRKFCAEIFRAGNIILLLGIAIRFIEVADDIIFGGEVPAYSIFIFGIPHLLYMGLGISIVFFQNYSVTRSLSMATSIIWGIGGGFGVFCIMESIYWGSDYSDILSCCWVIGCFGLFYTIMRLVHSKEYRTYAEEAKNVQTDKI